VKRHVRNLSIVSGVAALGMVLGPLVWLSGGSGVTAHAESDAKALSKSDEPILYYRDPDGLPDYSTTPKKTSAGKDYVPVREGDDVDFDAKPKAAAPMKDASGREDKQNRVRFYRNPMGLPDTSPVPKKDSMGMDYLPVYADEQDDDSSVKISAGKLQKTGVQTEIAEMRVLNTMVRAPGIVKEDERLRSVVSLRFEGFIDNVAGVTTGTHVHKGETLMRIYGPALSSAAAEYVSALNARPEAGISSQVLRGARRRLENLDAPESLISQIERTREVPINVDWPAPQDGEIVERTAVNGMRAGPGDVLFRLSDHSVVWVIVDVAERDLGLIRVGQKAVVRPRAFQSRPFTGQVTLIYPHLRAETRTAQIRIELTNPDDLLRPDMYADVEIATGSETPVLTVSNSAVIDSGERQIVLLDRGGGRFEPRDVKLGRRGAGRIEITDGLAQNDKVVVSANFLIDAESNLKAALNGLDTGEKSQ